METSLYTATFMEHQEAKAVEHAGLLRGLGLDVLGPEFTPFASPSPNFGEGYWLVVWEPVLGRTRYRCWRCRDTGKMRGPDGDPDVCDCRL